MTLRKDRHHLDQLDRQNTCQWVRCRQPADIVYLKDGFCWKHYHLYCAQQEKPIQEAEVTS